MRQNGNNLLMAYALTSFVVLLFLTLYFILKKQPREEYIPTLKEDEYLAKCKEFAYAVQSPKEGGQTNDKHYKMRIKLLIRKLKNKKYKGIFAAFCEDKNFVDAINKVDFSPLCDLASVDGVPRVVLLAKLCLASTDYIFTQDRFKTLAKEQNRVKTLTFFEINAMKEAFLYVILEKLYFIFENLNTLARVLKLAKKYVKDSRFVAGDKKYKQYSKSKLFLELCMIESNYSHSEKSTLEGIIDEIYATYSRLLGSVQSVLCFDFSSFYSPLEIYDKFDCFQNATEKQKFEFLALASRLSDEENLDEFMYAIRVEKYMHSASAGHSKVKKVSFFGKTFCVISHKRDIAMLAAGLRSDFFMRVFFSGNNTATNKSISKIVDFENSFEPIYKFENLNFGISTVGDVLQISPHLPKNVVEANVVFENKGINHNLRLKRGDDTRVYLGQTRIEGTKYIRLANKPLDITVYVKK